jgi:hypothetical protein
MMIKSIRKSTVAVGLLIFLMAMVMTASPASAVTVDGNTSVYALEEIEEITAANVTKIGTPLKTVYLEKGTSYQLPVVTYEDGKAISSPLIYTSSDEKTATISEGGKIKAAKNIKKKTKATITITAENGKKQTVTVYVVPKAKALKEFTATGAPKTMEKGATKQLTVKLGTSGATNVRVTYKSSKASILSVDKAGNLTAKKKGKATITVAAGDIKIKKEIVVK